MCVTVDSPLPAARRRRRSTSEVIHVLERTLEAMIEAVSQFRGAAPKTPVEICNPASGLALFFRGLTSIEHPHRARSLQPWL